MGFVCFDVIFFLMGFRGVRIGGEDSTEHVARGSYKVVPPELISELKAICQVIFAFYYSLAFIYFKLLTLLQVSFADPCYF